MTPIQNRDIVTLVRQIRGTPPWKRLKLMIQSCEHDADREVMFKTIRANLTADLVEFRKKPS